MKYKIYEKVDEDEKKESIFENISTTINHAMFPEWDILPPKRFKSKEDKGKKSIDNE